MSNASTRRPKVTLVSHVPLEGYRSKPAYVHQWVDLRLVAPKTFHSPYGLLRARFSEEVPYPVHLFPIYYPLPICTSTRWILATRDFGLRQWPPDVIHVENEPSSFIVWQTLLYRRRYAPQTKMVVSVWGNQPQRGWRRALDWMAQRATPLVSCFIAGTAEIRSLLLDRGVSPDRIATISLGVNVDYYRVASADVRASLRRKLGLADDEFVIGYVGRFSAHKGLEDLLQAFGNFRADVPGIKARLLCVGSGALEATLRQCGLDVTVVSPGMDGKVLPYYQVMDTLVLPSRTRPYWKEQFGRVLVEAMACGVPVIGSSSGSIPEVVGDAGLIFPEGQAAALAADLSRLAQHLDRRERQAEAGRRRAVAEYSDEQIAARTAAVYYRVLGLRAPAAPREARP